MEPMVDERKLDACSEEPQTPHDKARLIMADVSRRLTEHVDPDDLAGTSARLEQEIKDRDALAREADAKFVAGVAGFVVQHEAAKRQIELERIGLVELLHGVQNRMPCTCDRGSGIADPECPLKQHADFARQHPGRPRY